MPKIPPTCTNCRGNHPANYSKCLALLAFLAKRSSIKAQQTLYTQERNNPSQQFFPELQKRSHHASTRFNLVPQLQGSTKVPATYANITFGKAPATRTPSPVGDDPLQKLGEVKASDLDIFLRIIDLIQIHYVNCTSTYDKVKATVRIVKELEIGP